MKKNVSEDLHLKLDSLPTQSGVYLMKDRQERIIYIGKAKNLRSRVRSYFQESGNDSRPQIKALMQRVCIIDHILTDTEQEALILEATQIKAHKPRYNILLKDDKKYPFIRITNETFPRIFATRDIIRDGSRYLGPFSNSRAMHTTLDLMHKIFPIRSCTYQLPTPNVKVCLDFHIKRCEGPCEQHVSPKEYQTSVHRAVRFLKGRNNEIIKELNQRMEQAAANLHFEQAAKCRDQLQALESMQARQKVVLDEAIDRDVIGLARHDDLACCSVLEIREGRLLGQKHHFLGGVMNTQKAEIISVFIRQFYLQTDFIPTQIHVPVSPTDAVPIQTWLETKAKTKIELKTPQRGPKARTLDMAETNALQYLKERQIKQENQQNRIPQSITALQRDLKLATLPRRIEGIDISHFQGSDTMGSIVCFVDGRPRRSEYRSFKIRNLDKPDDFASMHQVVNRRFRGLRERGEPLPDLLMVDGGKGQLSSALQALRELGLENQPVIGLAKRLEEIFIAGNTTPLLLPKVSASLRMLQHLRDEAHRFALKHSRDLRTKRTITSVLDQIPGIGPKRRTTLLKTFGSVQRIRDASIEQISQVKGFSQELAEDLKSHLNTLLTKATK